VSQQVLFFAPGLNKGRMLGCEVDLGFGFNFGAGKVTVDIAPAVDQ
jgi:hypothetical protein